eukprot:SAG31_NODE_454_length_15434_cov_39.578285_1_plen_284_part_00
MIFRLQGRLTLQLDVGWRRNDDEIVIPSAPETWLGTKRSAGPLHVGELIKAWLRIHLDISEDDKSAKPTLEKQFIHLGGLHEQVFVPGTVVEARWCTSRMTIDTSAVRVGEDGTSAVAREDGRVAMTITGQPAWWYAQYIEPGSVPGTCHLRFLVDNIEHPCTPIQHMRLPGTGVDGVEAFDATAIVAFSHRAIGTAYGVRVQLRFCDDDGALNRDEFEDEDGKTIRYDIDEDGNEKWFDGEVLGPGDEGWPCTWKVRFLEDDYVANHHPERNADGVMMRYLP